MRSQPAVTTYAQIAQVLNGQQAALLGRRFWRATVSAVDGVYPGPYRVQVIRNGENIPNSTWYAVPGHVAVGIGDDVFMVNLDQGSAVVSHLVISAGQSPAARLGRGAPVGVSGPPTGGTWLQGDLYVDQNSVTWVCQLGGTPGTWGMASGWYHWSRYVVGPGGAGDTSSNPGGDIPLPSGYTHAWVIVSNAIDTSASSTGSFAGMQIGVSGGAIDTGANYIWTDKDVFTTTAGVNAEAISGSPNAQDAAWSAFVLTGGGTGAWPSSANIYLPSYSNANNHQAAFWDIFQINNSTAVRRMGGGYHAASAGATTLLHFFARTATMAAGTMFDLYVSA